MSSTTQKRIVVKLGTKLVTKENGLLDHALLTRIVSQVAALKRQGVQVVVVSSGAMGAGRALVRPKKTLSDVQARQLLAAVGQVPLIETYRKLFEKEKTVAAQVLATKEDFGDREHYFNMKSCFETLLCEGVVPVVNENDVVSVSELMFTDNDELAGLIAAMMNVEALIILTTVDGILDAHRDIIRVVGSSDASWKQHITPQISSFSRGGMRTKADVAKKLSGLGITTHIANGTKKNVLLDVVSGREVGTRFAPEKKATNLKKRIAYARGQEKGAVRVNERAVDVLLGKRSVASLLPVGATHIEGAFQKGEIISVKDHTGKVIGWGIARYGSDAAKTYLGQKNAPALIHYNYLYLEVV